MHFMDESFWVAVGFVIFLYFAYKPIKKAIINSLDARINEIKQDLAETEKLRAEAKALLSEVQNEMKNFEKYKEQVLSSAKVSTERLVDTRSKELDLELERKSNSAIMSIENEKAKASSQLKNEFTDNVISVVRSYLVESKNNSVSDEEIIKKFIKK
jgi:F-type H+-transporting ATPase subunit b